MHNVGKTVFFSLFVMVTNCYAMEIKPAISHKKIFQACEKGDLQRVKRLSLPIDDINKVVRKREVLVENGKALDECRQMFKRAYRSEKTRDTLLEVACEKDCFEIVKYLVEKKRADVNLVGINPTPLFFANMFGNAEVGKFLILNGARLLCGEDKFLQRTALRMALYHSNTDFFGHFLESEGLDINVQDEDTGWTVLHSAVSGHFLNAGEYKIKIKPVGKDLSYKGLIKFLLSKGADPRIKNNNGHLAIDYSRDDEITKILKGETI